MSRWGGSPMSPYLPSRVDANQPEIVSCLRKLGYSVQCTHAIGGGFPDIVIGKGNKVWLAEIKNGAKPPSQRQFTPHQRRWWFAWAGHKMVLCSIPDCFDFDRQVKAGIIPTGNNDAIYQLSLY